MKEENREVIIVKHEQIMVKEENKPKLATYIERQKCKSNHYFQRRENQLKTLYMSNVISQLGL